MVRSRDVVSDSAEHGFELPIPARRQHFRVEARAGRVRRARRALGDRPFRGGDRLLHPANLRAAGVLRRESGGERLEGDAESVDVAGILHRQRSHPRAASVGGLDQLLLLELAQRLAKGNPAHAELLGQASLDQTLAGAQLEADDRVEKLLVGVRLQGHVRPRRGIQALQQSIALRSFCIQKVGLVFKKGRRMSRGW